MPVIAVDAVTRITAADFDHFGAELSENSLQVLVFTARQGSLLSLSKQSEDFPRHGAQGFEEGLNSDSDKDISFQSGGCGRCLHTGCDIRQHQPDPFAHTDDARN